MDWTRTRHVILTHRRDIPAHAAYHSASMDKAIPRMVRGLKLSGQKWLWVLEFHADEFPHWHLLIESKTGSMIGKHAIQAAWRRGNVWESPIRSAGHWNAIIGYHRGKGYLAGESKAHQLTLPRLLTYDSRVRKFGRSAAFQSASDKKAGTPAGDQRAPGGADSKRERGADVSYAKRFEACRTWTSIGVNGHWTQAEGRVGAYEECMTCAERVNKTTYVCGDRAKKISLRKLAGVSGNDIL